MIAAAVFLVFPLCLAFAACSDLFTMTIPNRVSIILAVTFLVLALSLGMNWQDIAYHFAGAALVFGVCFLLFAANVMGGGDAKLLSAAALWFGWSASLPTFLIYTSYLGGILTLAILVIRWRAETIMAIGLPMPSSILHAKKIPYGIAIAVAGFIAYPTSPLMMTVLGHLN